MTREEYKKFLFENLEKYKDNPGRLNKILSDDFASMGTYGIRGNIDKCIEGARRKNKPIPCNRLDEDTVDFILISALTDNADVIADWLLDDAAEDYLYFNYDGLYGGGYICFPNGEIRVGRRVQFMIRKASQEEMPLNNFGFCLWDVQLMHNPEKLGALIEGVPS